MDLNSAVLATLGSPRRREIVRLVWNEERSAGEIHRAMPDVTFGAVSLHLRTLTQTGLLEVRGDRQYRFYRARKEAFGPVGQMLESMWDDALHRLKLSAELEASRRGPRPSCKKKETQERLKDGMPELTHLLERTLVIEAPRSTVFRFFTETGRWAAWWGDGSTIDARPGGRVLIRYPNGVRVLGEVLEIVEPEHIVFTYGYESGKPIAPAGSRVTIRLEAVESGTRLHLTHAFAEADVRDQHVQGWRFQLSLFANLVADEINAGAPGLADAWFAAWSISDGTERARSLEEIAAPEVRFRDRYARIDGLAELSDHIAASLRFMPGVRLERKGAVRHCQHKLLVDWVARGSDGAERMSGVNVFVLDARGRIASVTGFLNQ